MTTTATAAITNNAINFHIRTRVRSSRLQQAPVCTHRDGSTCPRPAPNATHFCATLPKGIRPGYLLQVLSLLEILVDLHSSDPNLRCGILQTQVHHKPNGHTGRQGNCRGTSHRDIPPRANTAKPAPITPSIPIGPATHFSTSSKGDSWNYPPDIIPRHTTKGGTGTIDHTAAGLTGTHCNTSKGDTTQRSQPTSPVLPG